MNRPMLQEPLLSMARHKLNDMLPGQVQRFFPQGCDLQVFVEFTYRDKKNTLEAGFWRDGQMEWGVSAGEDWKGNTITLTPIELLD